MITPRAQANILKLLYVVHIEHQGFDQQVQISKWSGLSVHILFAWFCFFEKVSFSQIELLQFP